MMSDRHYFKPNEIPKEITVEIYLLYRVSGWSKGSMHITDFWCEEDAEKKVRRKADDFYAENVLLAKFSITIEIPEGVDPTKKYLQVLRNERRRLLSQHHVELKRYDDKIAEFTALEYKPQGEK